MLVLTTEPDQIIRIAPDIVLKVLRGPRGHLRLGIHAPGRQVMRADANVRTPLRPGLTPIQEYDLGGEAGGA